MPHSPPGSVLALPSELTELCLIYAAASGDSLTISAVAQTCRALRTLVYGASDHHLWREVFLSAFDDPRVGQKHDHTDPLKAYRDPSDIDSSGSAVFTYEETPFDWGNEYRRRVWARNYLLRRADPKQQPKCSEAEEGKQKGSLGVEIMSNNLKALEVLLSVIETALPSPPTFVFSFPKPDITRTGNTLLSLSGIPGLPIFPPPPTAYSTLPTKDGKAPIASPSGRSARPWPNSTCGHSLIFGYTTSKNIDWVEKAVKYGFPRELGERLVSTHGGKVSGGMQGLWVDEMEAAMMRAFGRVVSVTGFLPLLQEGKAMGSKEGEGDAETEAATHDDSGSDSDSDFEVDSSDEDEESGKTPALAMITTVQQRRRALRIARMRVYNMHYLHRARHWGPYLLPPSLSSKLAKDPRLDSEAREEFLTDILSLFEANEAGHTDNTESESGNSSNPSGGEEFKIPEPHELYPDWTFLAACRVIVEANLRNSVGKDELSGLFWLEGLRRSSAMKSTSLTKAEESSIWGMSGSGKKCETGEKKKEVAPKVIEKADENTPGWDWAGVTGTWRRCICWMDYRDLILHQLSPQYNGIQEATRIVPMTLRVASRSPCPIPGYEHRPTLHVVGETAGPSSPAGGQSGHRKRRMHGTVGVIADGSVRWNLYSCIGDEGRDEWVTEGIQIGPPTSAMGVLGMWTGAGHERMDPCGPFWAWRVG